MRDPSQVSLKPFFFALILALTISAGWFIFRDNKQNISSFEECKKAGNPIMESYPEQCTAGKQTFVNTTQLTQ